MTASRFVLPTCLAISERNLARAMLTVQSTFMPASKVFCRAHSLSALPFTLPVLSFVLSRSGKENESVSALALVKLHRVIVVVEAVILRSQDDQPAGIFINMCGQEGEDLDGVVHDAVLLLFDWSRNLQRARSRASWQIAETFYQSWTSGFAKVRSGIQKRISNSDSGPRALCRCCCYTCLQQKVGGDQLRLMQPARSCDPLD
jgi:hypothetical protein